MKEPQLIFQKCIDDMNDDEVWLLSWWAKHVNQGYQIYFIIRTKEYEVYSSVE